MLKNYNISELSVYDEENQVKHTFKNCDNDEFYGLIVSKKDISCLLPEIVFDRDGNLVCKHAILSKLENDYMTDDEYIPLLLKRIDFDFVMDVYTGAVFIPKFDNYLFNNNREDSIENFQEEMELLQINNLLLNISNNVLKKIYVDDRYIKFYSEYWQNDKDNINKLKYLYSKSKILYDEELVNVINDCHLMANTENAIYNIVREKK